MDCTNADGYISDNPGLMTPAGGVVQHDDLPRYLDRTLPISGLELTLTGDEDQPLPHGG